MDRKLTPSPLENRILYCSHTGDQILQTGTEAERFTVKYLTENLNKNKVGNYIILVNYNLPIQNSGARGTLEIDLVVITKFGVFPIEVKNWYGQIDAYDGYWMQDQKHKHSDVFSLIDYKARVLHSKLFGHDSVLSELNKVSVTPIIALFRGKRFFNNYSHYDSAKVLGVDNDLILALSTEKLLFRGHDSKSISDEEITQIGNLLYGAREQKHEVIIGSYRILGELSSGDLFKAYEGVHSDFPDTRVRIKVYNLSDLPNMPINDAMKQIKRGAEAVWRLEAHPNILQTRAFFPEPTNPEMFYEVTEPIKGERLDEFLARFSAPIPLEVQLECLKQLCKALGHAHNQKIFHRNISPETVFVIQGEIIKLADFDFAKIEGTETIARPGEVLVDGQFTAPELFVNPSIAEPFSDIYSLGVLWYFLANHPKQEPFIGEKNIEKLQLKSNKVKELMKKMTSKAPANRPQSAEKVLRQLEEIDNLTQG